MKQSNLRIGVVQMSMAKSVDSNVEKAGRMVEKAAELGADVVCLPELFAWMYFPAERGATPFPERIPGKVSAAVAAWAKENQVIVVGGSLYEVSGRGRYNTSLTFDHTGKQVSKYRKVHIPMDEHYYEQDYFKPGRGYAVAKTSKGAFGTLICFDQWYPEPARVEKLMGAQVLFYPTAIGRVDGIEQSEGDWKRAWEAVQVGHAISNSVVVCSVNRVGREGGTSFWGGSFVCDQFGKVLRRAGPEEEVFVADVDLALGGEVEAGWGFMRNRRKSTYSKIVS